MGYSGLRGRGYFFGGAGGPATVIAAGAVALGDITAAGVIRGARIVATTPGTAALPALELKDSGGVNGGGLFSHSSGNYATAGNGNQQHFTWGNAQTSNGIGHRENGYGWMIPFTHHRVASVTLGNATAYGSRANTYSTAGGAFTITLPSLPTDGQELYLQEADGSTNPLTVARNGQLINGVAADLVLTTAYKATRLIYSAGRGSWYAN